MIGLHNPAKEHDSCGIGFVVDIKNRKSHDIIHQGLDILVNLAHRGAVGADPLAGDVLFGWLVLGVVGVVVVVVAVVVVGV